MIARSVKNIVLKKKTEVEGCQPRSHFEGYNEPSNFVTVSQDKAHEL